MIKIKNLTVTSKFRYLWLKYITGVNLSAHCAGCFKGVYSKQISPTITNLENAELNECETNIFYLCGVATPYNWSKNFHLAFTKSAGDILDYSSNGIHVVIENAKQLPISANDIDYSLKYAEKKEYYTCRNWQFANYLRKHSIF
ncbi:MAG: hypothetical protein ACTTJ7_08515 [Treponema sp.]